ncbi:SURF1 family protein [Corynebacterium timonense]|uniref:SURF1-like protein n=1 Tax=Corynebacterium timonense TaxID=441500 RepID=A0A1H1MAJ9_9CORY|nr:SURF1 family protein [Corynebacterium timonense]SDR83821.1 Cytochrome oxidase assembly protein ShyY1 [Corynebacterium timonense]
MATTNNKPWWKTFLTPGWVIAALLIAAFSYFAFTFLAPWQLGKNEALVERNEHIERAFDSDPIPFDPSAEEWSRVSLTGRYVPDGEVLLRLRPVDRTPAFQVLTPFALDSGDTVLVNRGWVPAEDGGTQVPAIEPAPTGRVTATGFLRADEGVHPTPPMHDQGHDMVYSISTEQVSELSGLNLATPYVQLAAGEPGELQAIPLPQLDTGNHLSYGLQWIAFGILAPGGLIYFIWAETRERRRFREEQEALLADAPLAATPIPNAPAPEPASHVAPAPRPRYGSGKRNPWAASYDRQEER